MAKFEFINNFNKGLNLDLDQLHVPAEFAIFIKNLTNSININQGAPGASGSNKLVYSPLEGNQALSLSGLPSGNNYCIGFYSSEVTNEGYFALHNSNGDHSIWVISGNDGSVRKMHQNTLLPFVLDPAFFLSEGRMTLIQKSIIDPVTKLESNFKFLIITNNNQYQCIFDVEASIATSSYSTAYFTASSAFYNPLELIHLGATLPIKCIGINSPNPYVPLSSDANKQNLLVNEGWQFRIKTWDVWGRPSDWGIISAVYSVLTGGGCINTSNGLARCVNLCFDAGNPLVKFITVAYRLGVGNDPTGATETGWLECETFRKYNDSAAVEWYNRSINSIFTTAGSGITFNASTNIITYTFCADKQSLPVDTIEAANTEPGLPRSSSTLFAIDESLGLGNNSYNFEPIKQSTVDAINFQIVPPASGTCPAAPLRTITFYSAIFKPVAAIASNHRGFIRTSFGKVVFGDTPGGDCGHGYGAFTLDETFADQVNPGFIAVLRGTDFKCVCRQGTMNPATGAFIPTGWGSGITAGAIYVQEYTITGVPAGKYIAQLSSHKSKLNDANLQQTSTYVGGISVISDLSTPTGLNSFASNPIKEIVIDCSAGNVTLNHTGSPLFTILDLVINDGSGAVDGYLYEKNGENNPIEMTPMLFEGITVGVGVDTYGSFFTDHNGFYFAATTGNDLNAYAFADLCDGLGPRNLPIYGPSDTSYPYITQGIGGIKHGDGTGSSGGCSGVFGNWANKVYLFRTSGTYPDAARRRLNQPINICGDPTTGVPGVPVVMTKVGPFQFTNSSGVASLIAHNRYDYLTATTGFAAPWLSGSIPNYSTSPGNKDQLIFSQKGGCEWNVCGSCDTFMANVTVSYLDCGDAPSGCSAVGMISITRVDAPGTLYVVGDKFNITGGTSTATGEVISVSSGGVIAILMILPGEGYSSGVTYPTTATTGIGTGLQVGVLSVLPATRTLCLTPLSVRPNGVGISGLQSGAKYPVAFWLHDVIGRHTSPQIKQGEKGFIYTPNLNDTSVYPYPTMALCGLSVTIPGGLIVDPVFTHMTFLVGANALFYDFFSWSADDIQYVDNTGATNPTNPTSIRVYFQSLNEYNKQYNFGTNVAWDFITQSVGQLAPNDVVQFIMNGDGTWLPFVKAASVTYDQYGSFFTIAYQPELANLQNGCLFRVIRPKQMAGSTSIPYFEQCLTLSVTNGLLPAGTYTIPYVDSYLLSRSIPVPVLKGQPGPIPPGGSAVNPIQTTSSNQNTALDTAGYSQNNKVNSNQVLIFGLTDFQTAYPFFFESPSAADLWGSHLSCRGRAGVPNPYEQQKRIGTEIIISNPLLNRGYINGLATFSATNKQVFARNTWGDITVILVETSIVLVICNNDHFLLRYGGSNVFVDPATGNVLSRNAQGIFQAPERKAGQNYGCTPYNINTIRKYAGTVRWLDTSGFLVLHNFSAADSNTDEAGYLGYLLQKLAEVNFQNLNGRVPKPVIYFMGGIDVKNSEYYLTVFRIPGSGTGALYINPYSEPKVGENETLVFDLKTLILKGFASFTPEYYGLMPKYYTQRQFISFKGGVPYTHHNNFNNPSVAPPLFVNFFGTQCECRITAVCNIGPEKVKRFFYLELYTSATYTPTTSPPSAAEVLFIADSIITETGQTSRLMAPRFTVRNNFSCAAFLCASNTPVDSNIPVQSGAHAILDGSQLQGRWCQVSLVTRSEFAGSYFEITSLNISGDGVEKSG